MTDTQPDYREPDDEPSDEQLRSEEAKRYRLERNQIRDTNAELIRQMAEVSARAEAAERQAIDASLRGKFADNADFWSQTQLADMHGEDGSLDMDAVSTHADHLLAEHPHWRATPQHGAAQGDSVNGRGLIGYGPRSVLDTDTVTPDDAPRGWGQFLQDAARGES